MSEFAYPFGLMDPRSPESEISSVDASFFCQREREREGGCILQDVFELFEFEVRIFFM